MLVIKLFLNTYMVLKIHRTFYEEENETNLNSMLWRHRGIIGYEHLTQLFNHQSLHTIAKYQLLEKFIKEEALLSATKYLPDFLSLRFQLIQKSVEYCSERRISELSISEFIGFTKGMLVVGVANFQLLLYLYLT